MWPFKNRPIVSLDVLRKEVEDSLKPEVVVEQPVLAVTTSPPIFNPTTSQDLEFSKYRCNAIARCLEQRREEGSDNHPEHDFMKAEALAYAWNLVGAKLWTKDDIIVLEKRIDGDSYSHTN